MSKVLDEAASLEMSARVKSYYNNCFHNARQAALLMKGASYVQGFLAFPGAPFKPVEHSWIEVEDKIIDPTFPQLKKSAAELYYFAAHRLSVKQLNAIIAESEEDYPEDDPLPVYGEPPYEYYGDLMLGGSNYKTAWEEAAAKCRELNQIIYTQPKIDT